jgi:ADP-ribosyltransferase exoenzyme
VSDWREDFVSRSEDGLMHPDSPAGGGGPGQFRVRNLASTPSDVPHPLSPAARAFDWLSLPLLDLHDRAEAVLEAMRLAPQHAPSEIAAATGEELGALLEGLIPGLLTCLCVVGATTAIGGAAGAAIGALAGGIGAVPGAALGASAGLEAGVALLDVLGLGFLADAIVTSVEGATRKAGLAVHEAWHSVDDPRSRWFHVDHAARGLAQSLGILMHGVLQGVVAFLTAKGGSAIASRVPELVAKLRSSRLGQGFASWVERRAPALLENERLKPSLAPEPSGGATPELAAAPEPAPAPRPPRPSKPATPPPPVEPAPPKPRPPPVEPPPPKPPVEPVPPLDEPVGVKVAPEEPVPPPFLEEPIAAKATPEEPVPPPFLEEPVVEKLTQEPVPPPFLEEPVVTKLAQEPVPPPMLDVEAPVPKVEPRLLPGDGEVYDLMNRKLGESKVNEILSQKRMRPEFDTLLSDEEYLGVHGYTTNLYEEINPALRAGNPGEWQPLVDKAVTGMDKMAANGFAHEGPAMRITQLSNEQIAQLFPDNGIHQDMAFMSSSSKMQGVFSGNTRIEILSQSSGVKVDSLSAFSRESEVLFRPGTEFNVVTKTYDPVTNGWHVKLTELVP